MSGRPHLLIFDGYADWEPAYAVAELRRSGGLAVQTVGFTSEPVRSMGGITALPDRPLSGVDPSDVSLLILPGGDRWLPQPPERELVVLLHTLDHSGVPLAAICGATVAIARAGLIRGRRHTSNGREFLAGQVPQYTEQAGYVDELAVRDRGLITASGLGAVEFAREIFAELGVFSGEDRERWYRAFKNGEL